MADQKRPIHEILSEKLVFATTVGLRNVGPKFVMSEIETIITALHHGKMKAGDAHLLAARHGSLPVLLINAGLQPLAEAATAMLADLNEREDEQKETKTEAPEVHEEPATAHG